MVLMVSALLTAFYLLPIVADAFFPGRDFDAGEPCEAEACMLVPVAAFSALVLLPGIVPAGLSSWLAGLAGTLM